MPAVQVLRQVWVQQVYAVNPTKSMRWRVAEDLPPAPLLISSPYDPEARYSKKRETEWVGYKVHLTETCDPKLPHLLTDGLTTPATPPDHAVIGIVQDQVAARDLLPSDHVVDAGYVTAERLVDSQQQQIDLVGPTTPEPGWQANAGEGFAASCFVIDREAQHATCPQGKTSMKWKEPTDCDVHAVVSIRFATVDCRACPVRSKWGASTRSRSLTIRSHDASVALQTARQRQHTEGFKATYRPRAGIEGPIAQGTRSSDLQPPPPNPQPLLGYVTTG